MDRELLGKLKKRLLELKSQILNGGVLSTTSDLHISSEDLADETDLASNIISQEISVSIREKELFKLHQIEEALSRMENNTYGQCEDCSEEINIKRLEKQPWTQLCIVHAEERERENQQFAKRA